MTRLLLIRHGETEWNVEGRYQGQTDVPLNERGRGQAQALAAAVAAMPIAAVYSSDLQRALDTARAVAERTGARLVIDARLREIDQGAWEGLVGAEVREQWHDLLVARRADPESFAPPGGEPFVAVRERVLAAVQDAVQVHPGETIALVSHGLALAIVRTALAGLPWSGVWDAIPANAVVVEMEA